MSRSRETLRLEQIFDKLYVGIGAIRWGLAAMARRLSEKSIHHAGRAWRGQMEIRWKRGVLRMISMGMYGQAGGARVQRRVNEFKVLYIILGVTC
jgi:hypothetical protein